MGTPKGPFFARQQRDREVLLEEREEVGRGSGRGLPWAGAAFQGCPLLSCQFPEASRSLATFKNSFSKETARVEGS